MDIQVYNKLKDIENHQENPFNTAVGQSVVAIEENFWSRLLRYGRNSYKTMFEVSLGAIGSINTVGTFSPTPNTTFIPKILTMSTSVDALVWILYLPMPNYNIFETTVSTSKEVYAMFRILKNTPFSLYFDGDLQISDGGSFDIVVKPLTESNGIFDGCIHGVEVSNRA